MAKKLPYLRFFPGDWHKDPGIQALNCEERGLWFQMLLIMFESERRGYLQLNGEPMKLKFLYENCAITRHKLSKSLLKFEKIGIVSKEEKSLIYYNRRMVRDEENRKVWENNGKRGGRPPKGDNQKKNQKINQSSNQTPDNDNDNGLDLDLNNIEGKDFTIEDLNITEIMRREIEEFKPGFHFQETPQEWAEQIQFIRRSRKKDLALILELWGWARADKFWKRIILTPWDISRNWDKLEIARDNNPSDGDWDTWAKKEKRNERTNIL